MVLLVGLVAIAVLCVGGLGVGYFVYDTATRPNRSDPSLVVRQYLTATFDQRDESRARLFTCGSTGSIAEMQNLLKQVQDLERRFDIKVTVTWEQFASQVHGSRSDVTAYVKVDVPEADGRLSRGVTRWRFALEEQSGWRVCDAHRIE